MPYQFFIAFRYLRSKKKNKGVSLNTAISAGGVAVGVMVLLVVLSVMSGFHEDLQNKILGFSAHALVLNYRGNISDYDNVLKKVAGDKDVISASPFVHGYLMVSSGKNARGALLRGIDPSYETKTTDIAKYMKNGKIDDLNAKDKIPGIVIGKELAQVVGVLPGDKVNVISPVGEIGPLGMLPKMKEFRVVGIFEVGMFEYDSNLVLTNLSEAQKFFDMGNTITGIELKVKDIYKVKNVMERIKSKLDFSFYSRDWMQMHKILFSALKLEKLVMFIILVLIILVASFNIVGSLIMNVVEKSREIAILKTMGATNKGIMSVFMLQGLFIGVVGMLIGLVGGYLVCIFFNNYFELPGGIYYMSRLPIKMKMIDFVAVSVSAVVISFLATIYPAWQAAKMDPVEPLRYE